MKYPSLKKAILATTIAAAITANSAVATEVDEDTKRVGKGFGIGAVIGSIVAGPVGLVMGSAAGAVKVQQDIRDERLVTAEAERVAAEAELVEARSVMSELKENLVAATETKGLYEPGLEPGSYALEVMFRTASYDIGETDRAKLNELASMVSGAKAWTIHLEGFSDPRGDAEYNLQLSAQRIDAVRQALTDSGIEEGRIQTVAHGEALTGTTENDIDGCAMERRVSVTLRNEHATKGVAQLNL